MVATRITAGRSLYFIAREKARSNGFQPAQELCGQSIPILLHPRRFSARRDEIRGCKIYNSHFHVVAIRSAATTSLRSFTCSPREGPQVRFLKDRARSL